MPAVIGKDFCAAEYNLPHYDIVHLHYKIQLRNEIRMISQVV